MLIAGAMDWEIWAYYVPYLPSMVKRTLSVSLW